MKKEKMKLFLLYPQPAPAAGSRDSGCWVVVEVMMGRGEGMRVVKIHCPKKKKKNKKLCCLSEFRGEKFFPPRISFYPVVLPHTPTPPHHLSDYAIEH